MALAWFARVLHPVRGRGPWLSGSRVCLHGRGVHSALNKQLEKSLASRTAASGSPFLCTIFDAAGTPVRRYAEVKKLELFAKYNLLPRDLRQLDRASDRNALVPLFLLRPPLLVVTMLNLRALIKSDRVLVFSNHGTAPADLISRNNFLRDLETRLQTPSAVAGIPYEIRALEAVLVLAVETLATELKVHTMVVLGLLTQLETNIDKTRLRYLLVQNKKLTAFAQKATLVRDALDEVLDDDDFLNGLYLLDAAAGSPRSGSDHTEVEMLLELYLRLVDEIVQQLELLIANIRTTEEVINIVLDANRNLLMLLGLRFSVGLLTLGLALFVAAVYGMNLENFIEESPAGMPPVVVGSMIVVVVTWYVSLAKLRRLQRVTLHG